MIYEFQGKYRWLSNYWPVQLVSPKNGMVFPSAEHAYQACKCALKEDVVKFTRGTAAQAKALGYKVKLRGDWAKIKLAVMENIVRIKFAAKSELARKLVATGDEELVEGNWWGDTFWGVSRISGDGQNHLGKLLMKIRKELIIQCSS